MLCKCLVSVIAVLSFSATILVQAATLAPTSMEVKQADNEKVMVTLPSADDVAESLCCLADKYEVGLGVKKNVHTAFRLFYDAACTQRYPRAFFELGRYCEKGLGGVGQNLDVAKKFYEWAAQLGYEPAKAYLSYLKIAPPWSWAINEEGEETAIIRPSMER